MRTDCEVGAEFEEFIKARQLQTSVGHKIARSPIFVTPIQANLGVGMLPESAVRSDRLRLIHIAGLDLKRTVYLYGVAGRQRSNAASALVGSCAPAIGPPTRRLEASSARRLRTR